MFKKSIITLLISFAALSAHADDFVCDHGIVDRAGVALVKHYPGSKPGLDFTVLVGIDASKTHKLPDGTEIPMVNFFAGMVDHKQDIGYKGKKCSRKTAVRELHEETSEAINLSPRVLQEGQKGYEGYVYSGDLKPAGKNTKGKNYTQLFFLRDDRLKAQSITQEQAMACKKKLLPHCYREARATCTLSLQEILDRARVIQELEDKKNYEAIKDQALYNFYTCGDGQCNRPHLVHICSHYLKNIARDLVRDPDNFPGICARLTDGKVK